MGNEISEGGGLLPWCERRERENVYVSLLYIQNDVTSQWPSWESGGASDLKNPDPYYWLAKIANKFSFTKLIFIKHSDSSKI